MIATQIGFVVLSFMEKVKLTEAGKSKVGADIIAVGKIEFRETYILVTSDSKVKYVLKPEDIEKISN